MSRYRGPRLRLMRALGVELPGLSRKTTERRPFPPGQHKGGGRRKLSGYAVQLREKQKLRFNYGVTERQMRRYVAMAFGGKGNPGHMLLQLLERRLDNVVFRCGFAPTIPSARQLINHGHVRVNNKRVDIASFLVKGSEKIALTPKAEKMPVVVSTLATPPLPIPTWIERPEANLAIVKGMPDRDSFPFPITEQMIVEYYTQRT